MILNSKLLNLSIIIFKRWVMHFNKQSLQRIFIGLLYLLPLLSLFISAVDLLKYGIDMPYFDDWREYAANKLGSFELSYLFKPANDTLYPFGLFLDSLAFIFLDGNSIAYQFISLFVIQGGILFLTYKIMEKCELSPLNKAIAFSLTILILQPDSYWGQQNLAYHQAIPLIGILTSIYLFLSNTKIKSLAYFILALCSGLSYTSGAFSMLALGILFLIIKLVAPKDYSKNSFANLFWLILPALATSLAQLWVIVGIQHGTHRPDAPMAFPWESDFWWFMAGKVGRSLLFPEAYPLLSFILTLFVIGATLFLTIKMLSTFFQTKNNTTIQKYNLSVVIVSLFSTIFVYLILVSAGRANMRPESYIDTLQVFISGYPRFHFYWVTLLWPFVVLAALSLVKNKYTKAAIITLSCLFLIMIGKPAFDHKRPIKDAQNLRLSGISCVQSALDNAQKSILCPTLLPTDLRPSLSHALNSNASFLHYFFNPSPNVQARTSNETFRLSDKPEAVSFNNIKSHTLVNDGKSLSLTTDADPQLYFNAEKGSLHNCLLMEVNASIHSRLQYEYAQLFYRPTGSTGFSEENSQRVMLNNSESQQLNFMVKSGNGFEDDMRFDPITGTNTLVIDDLVVKCRFYR